MQSDQAVKKRTFKTFTYRGVDLDALLDKTNEEVHQLFNARQRRKLVRNSAKTNRKIATLCEKLVAARKACDVGEKPQVVKTHGRNITVVPEMIGSIVGVYNGKTFVNVEIKPEMIGHYLGEFSMTYKPCFHGRAGAKGMAAKMIPF